jgi:hypothetical protein
MVLTGKYLRSFQGIALSSSSEPSNSEEEEDNTLF